MDCILTLLDRAESAGLSVMARGTQLVIKGPKRAAAIVQELILQKAAVLGMLSAKAPPGSTGCQDGMVDLDAGSKLEENRSAHPCPPDRSTKQLDAPSETTPATIIYDGKSYDVALTHGLWFFRAAAEASWTACSDEFAAIVEELLQARKDG